MRTRIVTSSLFLFALFFGASEDVRAQSYCAFNPRLSLAEPCFSTRGEAEAYVRQDNSPNQRRRFLAPVAPRIFDQYGQKMTFTEYRTRAMPPEDHIVTWYYAFTGIDTPVVIELPTTLLPELSPEEVRGRHSEAEIFADILARDMEAGPGTATGSYLTDGGGAGLNRPDPLGLGRVQVHFNYDRADAEGRIFHSGRRNWGVRKAARYWCPRGLDRTIGGLCTNEETGYIRVYGDVNPKSCPASGRPCVPGTGAKEMHEQDFAWGSWQFSRHYSSIHGVPATSVLGDVWSHTFVAVVKPAVGGDTLGYGVDDQRHLDTYYKITADLHRSENETGKVLRRTDGSGGLQWKLSRASGREEYFDANGRLARIELTDNLADSVNLTYCDSLNYYDGLCTLVGELWKVTDGRGRALEFLYSPTTYEGDPATSTTRLPRLIEIRSEGVWLVQYEYDAAGRLVSAIYPDFTQKVYHYQEPANLCVNSDGVALTPCPLSSLNNHLTGMTDEKGIRLGTYTYDQLGRVTSSRWSGGAFLEKLKYPSGTTREVTYPSGRVALLTLANQVGFYKPTSIADSAGAIVTQYDAQGRKTRETDKRNSVQVFEYSGERVSAVTSAFATPEQKRVENDWNTAIDRLAERRTKNAAGSVVARQTQAYNSRGQLVTSTQTDPATAATRTTTYAHCEAADVATPNSTCPILGLLKSVDGARTDVSDITTFAYYPSTDESGCDNDGECHRKGDPWTVTNALGHVSTTARYDRNGRPTRMLDANGVATDLEYHPRGWLAARKVRGTNTISESDDAITRYTHDAIGQVTRVTQPDGDFLDYEYDDAHRLTAIQDALGNRLEYTLDNAGNRIAEVTRNDAGAITRQLSRVYDQLGRLDQQLDAQQRVTDLDYDASGNQVSSLDALSHETRQAYDPLNRLRQTIQDYAGLNVTTGYTYDALDRLTTVTDPKGLATGYTYDGLGNLTQLSSPDTGITSYTHDAAGNRLTQTDARGITATYAFDALNRLTSISYPAPDLPVSFQYDQPDATTGCDSSYSIGRPTRMTDASGNTTYCYDPRGNITTKTQVTGNTTLRTGYIHSNGDRLQAVAYPAFKTLDYRRDESGNVTEIKRRLGFNWQFIVGYATYRPFGPIEQIAFGDDATLDFAYDTNDYIDTVGGSALALNFDIDEIGNVIGLATDNPAQARSYGYDPLARLKRVDGSGATLIEAFTYDGTGNRLTKQTSTGIQAYGYPATSHRLASIDATSRAYDATGNLVDRGDGWTFEFDKRQRLATVRQNGSVKLTNGYNGKGERVTKTVGSTTDSFFYDEGGRLLAEYRKTGSSAATPQKSYVWLDDRPVAVILHAGVYTGETLHIHSDHLGTPRVITRPADDNTIVWRWNLSGNTFGEHAPDQDPDGDGQALTFNLRYPGQYFDSESGLHYNYRRDYEPGTGRYVESDPIGLKGGISTYGYVSGNPTRFTDPSGLLAPTEPLLLTCIAGGPVNPACDVAVAINVCKWVGIGIVVGVGIGAASEGLNCNGDAANDACYDEGDVDDDDDGCDELLADMQKLYLMIRSQERQGQGVSMLISQYERQAALTCQMCPRICQDIPRFR